MQRQKTGIALLGNIVTDLVKRIDAYPDKGMLSNILSVSRAVGGSVPNVGIDLSRIDPQLPLYGAGRVGDDDNGRFVLEKLKACGMDVSQISVSPTAPTSFSDVMSLPSGERTFFHMRGANAELSPGHIDLDALDCRILHAGYILLLDQFDAESSCGGTVMADFLRDVQAHGIETSVDMVSDASADYGRIAKPSLKYTDYFIVNEIECCELWSLNPRRTDGALDAASIRAAMERSLHAGVRKKVIVHASEACFCLSRDGSFTARTSLELAPEAIRGSVGAGDAFAAGALHAIYNGKSDEYLLEFASAAAACSLFCENAVDGMRSKEEIEDLMQTTARKKPTFHFD